MAWKAYVAIPKSRDAMNRLKMAILNPNPEGRHPEATEILFDAIGRMETDNRFARKGDVLILFTVAGVTDCPAWFQDAYGLPAEEWGCKRLEDFLRARDEESGASKISGFARFPPKEGETAEAYFDRVMEVSFLPTKMNHPEAK